MQCMAGIDATGFFRYAVGRRRTHARLAMELRHLRYFVALAEEGSFTRAARRMHVTQSTLSHQIKQIEDEVGQRLFDRIGRRVVITEVGESLLQSATRALREVDDGLRRIATTPDPLTGTLRIGATHTFNVKLIPDCLTALLERHPSLHVVVRELFASDVAGEVEAGHIDLGIAYDVQRGESLHFEALYVEEMVLAVSADHPFAARRKLRLVELHRQRMILPTLHSSTRRIIGDAMALRGRRTRRGRRARFRRRHDRARTRHASRSDRVAPCGARCARRARDPARKPDTGADAGRAHAHGRGVVASLACVRRRSCAGWCSTIAAHRATTDRERRYSVARRWRVARRYTVARNSSTAALNAPGCSRCIACAAPSMVASLRTFGLQLRSASSIGR